MESAAPAVDARNALRPRELHRRPHRSDLRDSHAGHRLDLGEDLLGCLVDVERAAADSLPRALPLLLRLLHAALLGRGRAASREPLGRLRALRGRADPGQLPCHPPRRKLHPPGRLHARRASDVREHVLRLLRLSRSDARPLRHALHERAGRKAARCTAPRASGGARMTTSEKYVTAAYLVVLAVVLVYVILYSFKLSRLEREVAELTELARRRKAA